MDFIKKNWLGILIALGVIFLFWAIFRSCNTPNLHTDEKAKLDSLNAVIERMQKDSLIKLHEDSIRDQVDARKYDSLRNLEKQRLAELKIANNQAKEYAYKYQKAIGNHDTSAAISNCGDLARQVIEKDIIISGFETITDSLSKAHTESMLNKDRQIAIWKGLYLAADSGRIENKNKYNGLSKDYGKQVKANKFNKNLSRGLAIVVLVLGGIAYFK